jgi:formate C-acetyltransferase
MGASVNIANMSDRVRKLKESTVMVNPVVDTERLRFMREVYAETDGLPTVIRRAMLFERLCDNKTIFIDDNPIVGSVVKRRSGAYPMCEYSCKWLLKDASYRIALGDVIVTDEDREEIREAVKYWADRCVYSRGRKIIREAYNGKLDPAEWGKAGVAEESVMSWPLGFITMNYEKVLNKGLKEVIAEVERRLSRLELGGLESHKQRHFLKAMRMCLEAVIRLARRYSKLAQKMAKEEKNPQRKQELEEISEICSRVPANPATSFREALQSFYFIWCAALIENAAPAMAPGRFSWYIHPFYKKDLLEGKITREEAIGLLEFLFVNLEGFGLLTSDLAFKANSGQTAVHISIGGLAPDGEDATNDLDYMLLEVQKRMRCIEPSLSLLYHHKLPEEFLLKAVELIRETGLGQPQFLNTETSMQRFFHYYPDITIEEARGMANVGCIPVHPHHSTSPHWGSLVNCAKMLELALNQGKDPLTGLQISIDTGDPLSFNTWEDLYEATKAHLDYCLPKIREMNRVSGDLMAEIAPLPFQSALVDDCIEKGADLMNGGARYNQDGAFAVGTIDLANSLAAIKKLVYEEKKLSMDYLLKALEADFKGYEDIRRMLLNAPKYGNDDPYVDDIVKDWYYLFGKIHDRLLDHQGRPALPEAFSVSSHFSLGARTGALPNGRNARISLTDATVSAQPGTDIKGPTALAKSAARAIDTVKYASNHLNMKFHPSALAGNEGARNLLALVKTYMDLGGYHIQFNCISSETLIDAQNNPGNYKGLVVRVAGFSAYFIHLDEGVQNELIKRTEVKFN